MSLRQDLQKTSSRRRRKEIFIRILIGIGIVGVITGIIIFLFYIPSLRISEVAIAGLSVSDEKELREEILEKLKARRFLILPKDHLIFFPKEEIQTLLANKFRVKDFEMEKDFPSGLKISIVERKTWAVWCLADSNRCLLIDREARAFESAAGFAGGAILKIIDARNENFLGKNILPDKSFEKIVFLIDNAPKRVGEEIKTVNIKSAGDTYLLYVKTGWYVLIDDETDEKKALENLYLALNSEIKERKAELEYIDLRFPDKVFYKYR